MATPQNPVPEFALYHPWPPLDHHTVGEWVKTMLLFFEGVAVVAPPTASEQMIAREEEILAPLADRGLFRVLDPGKLVQKHEAEAILEFLFSLASSLEERDKYLIYGTDYAWDQSLSSLSSAVQGGGIVYQRWGGLDYADRSVRETAEMLWEALQLHGVATLPDMNGVIRMHPVFWVVYEAFLAHSIYDAGLRVGLSLRPATDHAGLVYTQNAILDTPGYPSSGHVIDFDLQQVTLDLSLFELDEILQFREEYGSEFRRYTCDLRKFAIEVSRAKGAERTRLMRDRRDALTDAAQDLRRVSREWWRHAAASIGIGIAGGTWSAHGGDWPATILAVLGGAAGIANRPKVDNAFSYLFKAERSFAGRGARGRA